MVQCVTDNNKCHITGGKETDSLYPICAWKGDDLWKLTDNDNDDDDQGRILDETHAIAHRKPKKWHSKLISSLGITTCPTNLDPPSLICQTKQEMKTSHKKTALPYVSRCRSTSQISQPSKASYPSVLVSQLFSEAHGFGVSCCWKDGAVTAWGGWAQLMFNVHNVDTVGAADREGWEDPRLMWWAPLQPACPADLFFGGLRRTCGNNYPQSIDNVATCEIKAYNITQARNLVQKSKQCSEKPKSSNSHLLYPHSDGLTNGTDDLSSLFPTRMVLWFYENSQVTSLVPQFLPLFLCSDFTSV